MQEPPPHFQPYADWLKWRAGRFTAGPPQLLSQYGIQLEDWRVKPIATIHGLAEVTGIPTLVRWGQAIFQNRPIAEVEREYFGRIARELREAGVGVDEDALRRRVEQATMHAVMTALPLAVPLSRAEAALLAKSLGVGFGAVGAPTAFIRTAQGYPDEALKAFIEAGLAGTVITDAALVLRNLAPSATPEALAAIRSKVAQRRGGGAPWRDYEGEAFVKEIEEAIQALRRGDTSKYDALLKQFEEWQAKIDEFNRLYDARQKGPLSPDDEARYAKLLREVSRIRDKYDTLRSYIEAAREMGLEAGARRLEFERRTIEDLARAAQEAPLGPPPKDLMAWLQRVDVDFLLKLTKNSRLLGRYARRFGVDEQTLAERAALVLRERAWERLSELPPGELKKILMDEALLKKYAAEYGIAEDKLRMFIEDALQGRLGVKPPEPAATPERPPIEPAKPPERPPTEPTRPPVGDQFKPPEVEAGRGQVLVVRPKEEELQLTVRRMEDLPAVGARLRYLLGRARVRPEPQRPREVGRRRDDAVTAGTPSRDTAEAPGRADTARTADDVTARTADEASGRTADEVQVRTDVKVADADREVVVLDRDALRTLIPALPAYIFAMPAPAALAFISKAVGMPVALAPGIPRPSPREPFGSWLDRVFAGTGFTWRSLAAQKETFVFA